MGLAKDYIVYKHVANDLDVRQADYYAGKLGDGTCKFVRGYFGDMPKETVGLHRLDAMALVRSLNANEKGYSYGPYVYDHRPEVVSDRSN